MREAAAALRYYQKIKKVYFQSVLFRYAEYGLFSLRLTT
jgi:hypothetical protein